MYYYNSTMSTQEVGSWALEVGLDKAVALGMEHLMEVATADPLTIPTASRFLETNLQCPPANLRSYSTVTLFARFRG